jgi:hypothetical protein
MELNTNATGIGVYTMFIIPKKIADNVGFAERLKTTGKKIILSVNLKEKLLVYIVIRVASGRRTPD